jgi:hypothetical protein
MQEVARFPAYPFRAFACGDADRDGRPEFYARTPGPRQLVAFEWNPVGVFDTVLLPFFRVTTWDLGDTDRDSLCELVGHTSNAFPTIWEARSTSGFPDTLVWQDSVNAPPSVYITDLDMDSVPDITAQWGPWPREWAVYEYTDDNRYAIKGWLSPPAESLGTLNGGMVQSHDLDRDGKVEAFCAASDGEGMLGVFESRGNDSFGYVFGTRLRTIQCRISGAAAAKDLDGDGLPEVLHYASDHYDDVGTLWVIEAVGEDSFAPVWTDQFRAAAYYPDYAENVLDVGDVDGDSVEEFVVTTGIHVRLYRAVGWDEYAVIWQLEWTDAVVRLYDVNSDGCDELLLRDGLESVVMKWLPLSVQVRERAELEAVEILPSLVQRNGCSTVRGLLHGLRVEVLYASGRVAREVEGDVIRTQGLPAGAYFVRLTSGGVSVHKKLLILP